MTRRALDPGPDILAEAARWFVLLASGEATPADRARWQAWRAADTRHEAGWRRAEAATALFGGIAREQAPASAQALERRPLISRGRRRVLGGGLAGLFLAGLVGWQGWRRSDASADHLTAIGEQRSLTLADGSLLQLDTDTAVDIAFGAQARLVRLRRGRVLIATAPQKAPGAPPFMVETDEGRVRALGTRFTVRQHDGSTEVAVLEARVAIEAGKGLGVAPILSAGRAARFDRHGLVDERATQPADGAWSTGMLIADDMPLADFVAELARYRDAPLACDPAVRGLRISGTYPLADTDRVLAVLAATLPVRVQPLRPGDPARGLVVAR